MPAVEDRDLAGWYLGFYGGVGGGQEQLVFVEVGVDGISST